MYELVVAGGWLMLPIVLCSIVALAVIGERFWTLRPSKVLPANLVTNTRRLVNSKTLNDDHIRALQEGSPFGRILAAGLINRSKDRTVLKGIVEDVGRHVAHDLERFLNALGTIAAVTPLLGLLGTVVGMISVFTTITSVGVGDPGELASGISQALITTAAGLSVAIPSMMFHRFFRGRVDALVVEMEQEAIKLVELLHSDSVRRSSRNEKNAA
ncbi:MAG: MotA/TolQ/ExbB proton channel family protein [Pseudomonadota bacterium]